MKHLFNIVCWCVLLMATATAQPSRSLFFDAELAPTGAGRFWVQIALEAERLNDQRKPEQINLSFSLQSAQGAVLQSGEWAVSEQSFEKINQTFYFGFELQTVSQPEAVLVLTITDAATQETLRKDIPVRDRPRKVSFQLVNHTHPEYVGFALTSDSLELVDVSDQTIYLLHFVDDFLPAAPPMGNERTTASPALTVDTLAIVRTNQKFMLPKEGLFFAQADTTGSNGMGFRVQADYPKYREVENLTRCMIYISTDEEIKGMLRTGAKKSAMDNFWLNAGGTVGNAQQMVKTYYQRVAYANRNFTNYKEGWKTDKGMVHIIFGRPDEILKLPDGERWVYYEGRKQQRVTFEFMRRSNIFTAEHYELLRSSAYRRPWFESVELWRTGKIVE